MVVFRRLLTGLLAVALTHFSVVATAPAHTHQGASGHGLREIVVAGDHLTAADSAHDHYHGVNDHGAHMTDEAEPSSDGRMPPPDGSGEHAHVHAYPQLAALDGDAAVSLPVTLREIIEPQNSLEPISHSSFPPLRPPRVSL